MSTRTKRQVDLAGNVREERASCREPFCVCHVQVQASRNVRRAAGEARLWVITKQKKEIKYSFTFLQVPLDSWSHGHTSMFLSFDKGPTSSRERHGRQLQQSSMPACTCLADSMAAGAHGTVAHCLFPCDVHAQLAPVARAPPQHKHTGRCGPRASASAQG